MKLFKYSFLIFIFFGCKNVGPTSIPNIDSYLENMNRVAVLPFEVVFSEDYKTLGTQGRKKDWVEESRLAGLDLQKTAFSYLTERINKKNLAVNSQNYQITNKTLSESNVGIFEIPGIDKAKLGRKLNVEGVLTGRAIMEYSRNGFSPGMRTSLTLVDVSSGQIIWEETYFEQLSNRSDSPQDLSRKAINGLIKALPFKREGVN